MQRNYTRLVLSLTVTVAIFFGAGVIVAMLYVGPQITPPGSPYPLVMHDYSFGDVVFMGILFGVFSAVLSQAVMIPVILHDKRRCLALSKEFGVPLGRVLFLTQSAVMRVNSSRKDAFERALVALKLQKVWIKVNDIELGCIEAYTKPFFASRVTLRIDKMGDEWQTVVVSTPVSGFLILDFGRNFELVNHIARELRQE
ncbi:MAG: hypothetical protein JW941_09295 [Candidatus Coatesbacteria bacterium]|nr:hypothetical protein [Candidatus Coatesbacteria bacterium]